MNVLFWLNDELLNDKFISELKEVGLLVFEGYCIVGGMCVSIYNVMLFEGV